MAIGYNLSTSAFGGTAPLVITFLITVTHNDFIPAFYLIAAGLIAIAPILAIPETARASIRGRAVPGTGPAAPLVEPASN
jgi:MHS family proline/betaine transporter-like MFS transporter